MNGGTEEPSVESSNGEGGVGATLPWVNLDLLAPCVQPVATAPITTSGNRAVAQAGIVVVISHVRAY